ncbi:glutamate--tRNA ligase [Prochlorococcus marinus]|uniref:Glutamate--tRNA ligase n=1 Tax=Prochlorococcus marinus (strain MIT 9211) TaxID=93059 RepID=SYE_PROM4|nr:glutamate--tRNA ligase [Prochlorococcus marinus]A9BE95.2 RecName: Full=Glutamate--tRNA ligase; AltName: Full=Glutamyl-tRNA synthetase; Short=GluRS [Prochlorococcus marinus str. MIT 9211]
MAIKVRLAPSPTGKLHIGTARTALFNWLFARKNNGSFLIRIEDTDKERSQEEYKENILEGLDWLGLTWDAEPIIQSNRIEQHREAIKYLLEKGLAYRCFTTEEELAAMREEQKSRNKPPRYDNRHRSLSTEEESNFLSEGRTAVIRFRIDDNESIQWNDLVRGPMNWTGKDLGGDMVIARRAPANEIGDPLYNLVVVIDDGYMGITHVIRGEDHIANTAKQILLYKALGLTLPKFAHTPLILNAEGKKLSKRDGVTSISDFKEMGYTSKAMSNYMTLLGWSIPDGMDEKFTIEESSKVFDFDRVNKAGAKFDWEKLKWLNSQTIHDSSSEEILKAVEPLFNKEGWDLPNLEWSLKLIELIKPSMTLLTDSVEQSRFFFEDPLLNQDAINQLEIEGAKDSLKILLKQIDTSKINKLTVEHAKKLINDAAVFGGFKKGLIMKSLRAALLGCLQGPDVINSWILLSEINQDKSRIERCL